MVESKFQFQDLNARTLLLTGMTRGIGRAILPGLPDQGLHVIAVSRGITSMEATREELGVDESRLLLHDCDLSDSVAVEATGRWLLAEADPIDAICTMRPPIRARLLSREMRPIG